MIAETDRLYRETSKVLDIQPYFDEVPGEEIAIQATYDPTNGVAVIGFFGLTDDVLNPFKDFKE